MVAAALAVVPNKNPPTGGRCSSSRATLASDWPADRWDGPTSLARRVLASPSAPQLLRFFSDAFLTASTGKLDVQGGVNQCRQERRGENRDAFEPAEDLRGERSQRRGRAEPQR